ncbi:flagellar biosynthesis protein FlhB [Heliorestis acidaminivorans]|uniref:Flagellar biosynthetic protein FlhB n=1 Tax=Heliorestis acidaminivorans TaxID=553427 RepID=A0A6I0F4C4_9FIRM|nr:flagellar biosynthesis protein FlhB [Heliorestis acidaminivorans]KAB2954383.1 flagellar biosynthesis protein FlhB [Heliorestis acidaminivorans]
MVKWNLQWFAGEKTEKATPKKRQDSRKKGQVARSQEVNSAIILLVTFLTLFFLGQQTIDGIQRLTSHILGVLTGTEITPITVFSVGLDITILASLLVAPFLLVAMAAGLTASYLQVGFLFSTEAIKVKWNRINPLSGFKRIFSKRALVELVKSILKVSFVGYIAYMVIMENLHTFPKMMGMDVTTALAIIANIGFDVGWRVALLLLFVAAIDLWYQRYSHEESIKMSKQEVKDEHKQAEGDPQIRSKIRQRMREAAMRRMMQELPQADVVITNPTHFAIALKYDGNSMAAPRVIAKGQDFLAQKIKEVAQTHGIPMVEDKPLAQTLYRTVEVGDQIPADLFQAVAEVFAFVFRMKQKKA